MLLIIWGVNAVGKTTWIDEQMDAIAEVAAAERLVCVQADLTTEYHTKPSSTDDWEIVKPPRESYWKGTQEPKRLQATRMIEDRNTLWVIESSRWSSGMHDHLLKLVEVNGGGLRYIMVATLPETAQQFIKDRCAANGKKYNDEYWTDVRLQYEAWGRVVNPMKERYEPAGVPCELFTMDYERNTWPDITEVVLQWAAEGVDEWYSGKQDRPDKGIKRVRQDNDSKAVVGRQPRL